MLWLKWYLVGIYPLYALTKCLPTTFGIGSSSQLSNWPLAFESGPQSCCERASTWTEAGGSLSLHPHCGLWTDLVRLFEIRFVWNVLRSPYLQLRGRPLRELSEWQSHWHHHGSEADLLTLKNTSVFNSSFAGHHGNESKDFLDITPFLYRYIHW